MTVAMAFQTLDYAASSAYSARDRCAHWILTFVAGGEMHNELCSWSNGEHFGGRSGKSTTALDTLKIVRYSLRLLEARFGRLIRQIQITIWNRCLKTR